MPIVNVSLRKGTPPEYRKAISSGIHKAMIENLHLPEDDYFQITHELEPENFVFDANFFGHHRSERMVVLQFFFNARSPAVKESFYNEVADNLVRDAGLRREDIMINIVEPAPQNWWIFGRTVDPETGFDSRMGARTP